MRCAFNGKGECEEIFGVAPAVAAFALKGHGCFAAREDEAGAFCGEGQCGVLRAEDTGLALQIVSEDIDGPALSFCNICGGSEGPSGRGDHVDFVFEESSVRGFGRCGGCGEVGGEPWRQCNVVACYGGESFFAA